MQLLVQYCKCKYISNSCCPVTPALSREKLTVPWQSDQRALDRSDGPSSACHLAVCLAIPHCDRTCALQLLQQVTRPTPSATCNQLTNAPATCCQVGWVKRTSRGSSLRGQQTTRQGCVSSLGTPVSSTSGGSSQKVSDSSGVSCAVAGLGSTHTAVQGAFLQLRSTHAHAPGLGQTPTPSWASYANSSGVLPMPRAHVGGCAAATHTPHGAACHPVSMQRNVITS